MTNEPTLLLRCVVGSQLHGTASPDSDTDIRDVVVSPMLTMLSPFRDTPPTVVGVIQASHQPKGDTETHELRRFCKLLSQCNMTALEILWSPLVQYERRETQVLRKSRYAFLDSKRLYEAAKGYAHSQLVHVDRFMTDGEQNTDSARAGKFAAAYVRVLHQTITLLTTGDYDPRDVGPLRDQIVEWKRDGFTKKYYRRSFNLVRADLTATIDRAYENNSDRFRQDPETINRLVRDIYLSCEQDRTIRAEMAGVGL